MEEKYKINSYNSLFSDEELLQIENHGITLEKIATELSIYKNGIPKTFLIKPATINDGIIELSEAEIKKFEAVFDSKKGEFLLEKFVPASGAASRMFKFLSEFLLEFNIENETINGYINRKNDTLLGAFLIGMEKFPFFKSVYNRLKEINPNFDTWKRDSKNYEFIKILIDKNEYDFANKPKGILPFHDYSDKIFTAIEEHLKETLAYAKSQNKAKIHFTISEEHQSAFEKIVENYESKKIETNYSFQQKNTDTIAVDYENNPLKINQKLFFRPGGHGALIYNLNALNSDIVFIKNIDNVSHNSIDDISKYKKVLAGYLIYFQELVFQNIKILESDSVSDKNIMNIRNFIENSLKIEISEDFTDFKNESQIKYLKNILDRPIRVCGMVKNENEPGGGPFWIRDQSGNCSLQIVESSQVDLENEQQLLVFKSATHFNPVDIVCGLKNYMSEKFNLLEFIDQNSGFIVDKSKNGINYKAYELPGLWNGAMANWITIFIEVPLTTFNPVKIVNDLLKPNHQPF
jgi:Domain of unknown function (DUF4301)